MNEHLLNLPDGATSMAFVVPGMAGFKPRAHAGGRAYVPKGCYKSELVKAEKKGSAGGGANAVCTFLFTGPDQFRGVTMMRHIPLPVGSQKLIDAGLSFSRAFLASVASSADQLDQLLAMQTEGIPCDYGQYAAQKATVYLDVRDAEYQGDVVSEIAGFVVKSAYDENPGPSAGMMASEGAAPQSGASHGGNGHAGGVHVAPAGGASGGGAQAQVAPLSFGQTPGGGQVVGASGNAQGAQGGGQGAVAAALFGRRS